MAVLLSLFCESAAFAAGQDHFSAQSKLDFLDKFCTTPKGGLTKLLTEEGLTPGEVYYWAILQNHGYLAEWSVDQKKNPSFVADIRHDPFFQKLYDYARATQSVDLDALQSEMNDAGPSASSKVDRPLSRATDAAEKADLIRPLLDLPEENIDVGMAALTIAKDLYPNVNIKAYAKKIDKLVEDARRFTGGEIDPDQRIRALNSFLFRERGFKYDFSDPYGRNIQNRILTGILDRKKGQCVTLPLLYLVVAQRLGYPVRAVSAPDHIFIRYLDPKLAQNNIEATSGGAFISDDSYMAELKISPESVKNGAYLKTLTNRELLSVLISGNAYAYMENSGDVNKAIRYWTYASKLYSADPTCRENIGHSYLEISKLLVGTEAQKWRGRGSFYEKKAKELGLVVLPMEEYVQKIREQAKAEGN